MRRTWVGAVAMFAVVLASTLSSAQSVDVVVRGRITDVSDAALPGATVTATNAETGVVRSTKSDSLGQYRLAPLPAGLYSVTAELSGFPSQVHENQTLHVGTTVTIDFTFDVLTTVERVDVAGGLAILDTARNTLTRLVSADELDQLPVVDRNFNGLAVLAPGVTPTGVYGGVDISGSRDFQNGYNVDGFSAEGLGAGEQRVFYAQDWIREFQVLSSQYTAEHGRASGGVLNVITRSGSNVTSARAYGFFRDASWDATPAFAGLKPDLTTRRLGATAGGKVIANRTFYFGGVEWFGEETSRVVNSSFPDRNGSIPATLDHKLLLAKVEDHAGDSTIYRLRVNRDVRLNTNEGVGGIRSEENGQAVKYAANDVAASWTIGVGGTAFNELRAAVTSTRSDTRCNFAEHNPSGTWFERQYPGAIFGCRNAFGLINSLELQLIDNYSWTRGAHDLKAGVQVSRGRSFGDYRFAREGTYRFPVDLPFDLSNPASYPSSFIIFAGPTTWDYTRWAWGAFVQDTWRLTSNLTIAMGVRYDLDGSYTALNRFVRVESGLNTVERDVNNVAPRLGVAWRPSGDQERTLLRGGIGAYYDQNHLDIGRLLLFNSVLPERSVVIDAFRAGLNPFWPDVTRARLVLAEALADNTIPDVSALPGAVGGTPDLERNLQVPYTIQASGGISHQFGPLLHGSADVVVARGLDQYVIRDANYDRDAAFDNRVVRPNPRYSFINLYGNGGDFSYRALQLQLGLQPGAAHLVRLSYTLGRNDSNTNTALHGAPPGGAMSATNPFDYEEDRGPTNHDVRHNLVVNGTTTLPLGVQLSALLAARSALPWSVVSAQDLDGDPFPDRPEPRNSRRGDSFFSIDARVTKTFGFGARRSVALFLELYNVTNTTNLTGYIGTVGAAQFGQAASALGKRRAQLGLRAEF